MDDVSFIEIEVPFLGECRRQAVRERLAAQEELLATASRANVADAILDLWRERGDLPKRADGSTLSDHLAGVLYDEDIVNRDVDRIVNIADEWLLRHLAACGVTTLDIPESAMLRIRDLTKHLSGLGDQLLNTRQRKAQAAMIVGWWRDEGAILPEWLDREGLVTRLADHLRRQLATVPAPNGCGVLAWHADEWLRQQLQAGPASVANSSTNLADEFVAHLKMTDGDKGELAHNAFNWWVHAGTLPRVENTVGARQALQLHLNAHGSSDPRILAAVAEGWRVRWTGQQPTVKPDEPEPGETARLSLGDELREWWLAQARDEIERTVPKVVEYGGTGRAVDLVDIGRDLLRAMHVKEADITDEWATETGIYFYIRGKLGRWTAALLRGERVSDDTLFDISVYCRMTQRTRAVGGWPI